MASRKWLVTLPYFREPEVPYCIIGKVTWGVVTACRIPESRIAEYAKYGFEVLIRDSEFPVPLDDIGTLPDTIPAQRNPNRVHGYGYSEDDGA